MEKKMYRLLALAVVFFLAGSFFFLYDRYAPKRSEKTSDMPKIKSSQDFFDPVLSRFPAPEKFQKFTYDSRGFNGEETFSVVTSCNDTYVTILIFSAAVDYRRDVTKAVFNRAFSCERGHTFSYALSKSDLTTAKEGDYYLIIADQGTTGTWYNPR